MGFDKLVRFKIEDKIYFGDLVGTSNDGFQVKKLKGGLEEGFESAGDEIIHVSRVS
jgi:hypothetical protein